MEVEEQLMKVSMRAAGCPDFEVEVPQSATVADLKIFATAGCEIDPELMKVIFKGKVLKDADVLTKCGVDGRNPIMLARGARPAAAAAAGTTAAALQPAQAAPVGSDAAAALRVTVKGPGGIETTIEASSPQETLAALRSRAAALCGLASEEAHLVHRGKILKDADGATLRSCGISDGDVVRVAKRAVQDPAAAAASSAAPAPVEAPVAMGTPMPAAWGAAPFTLESLQRDADAFNVQPNMEEVQRLQRLLAAQAAAAQQQRAHENQVPWEVRIGREVRAMGHQVRLLAAQRRREEALGPRARDIAPQAEDLEDDQEDPELLDHIARTMAEARARGAPVPNPAFFVDHALSRAREARALGERLDREASGMDPELADALAAAEETTSALARAPKRLGGGAPPGGAQ